VFVTRLCVLSIALAHAAAAAAQTAPNDSLDESRRFEIIDNSFLVEEAFNQEPGVFQNIAIWSMDRHHNWETSFTQEWPLTGQTHQLSYTLTGGRFGGDTNFGDVLLNYRYQFLDESPRHPAVSPRLSIVLPTTNSSDQGRAGLQVNLPFSKQFDDLYAHWNAGVTWFPRTHPVPAVSDERTSLLSPHLAASAIWRVAPRLNLLLEGVVLWEQTNDLIGRVRTRTDIISPGFRYAWNIRDKQIVVGAAAPLNLGDDDGAAILTYFSYESPFRR
jgi:hypothetical protein